MSAPVERKERRIEAACVVTICKPMPRHKPLTYRYIGAYELYRRGARRGKGRGK